MPARESHDRQRHFDLKARGEQGESEWYSFSLVAGAPRRIAPRVSSVAPGDARPQNRLVGDCLARHLSGAWGSFGIELPICDVH